MLVQTGTTYSFKFKTVAGIDFSVIDGIYKVTQELTYADILANKINMVESFYSKVGASASQWSIDIKNESLGFAANSFYKLESVNNKLEPTIIYITKQIIDTYPDANIKKYSKLMLVLDLSVFDNPTLMTSVKDKVEQLIMNESGIDTESVLSVYDDVWMTVSDYDALEVIRNGNKTNSIDLYTENQRLKEQLSAANVRVNALEEIIIDNSL